MNVDRARSDRRCRQTALLSASIVALTFAAALPSQELVEDPSALTPTLENEVVQDPFFFGGIEQMKRYYAEGDVEALAELERKGANKVVRQWAAFMLSGFRENAAISTLTAAIDDPEDWVRFAALDSLSFIGGEEARLALAKASNHPDAPTAARAREVLPRAQAGEGIEFETLARGSDSARPEGGWVHVADAEALASLWQVHRPGEPPPPVNFAAERVIGFFLGPQASAETWVEIVAAEEKSQFVRILVQRSSPATPEDGEEVAASPFHLARISADARAPHFVSLFVSEPPESAAP